MRRTILWFASIIPFAVWAGIQGCGGDVTNALDSGVDGTTVTMDSGGMDTSLDDTGVTPDSGSNDTGPSDTGADTGAFLYQCYDGGVTDCAQCNGRPRPCVNCMLDGGALVPYCVTLQSTCFPNNNQPYGRCPCMNANNCPEAYQVCQDVGLGLACRTCGETQTLNDNCKGGGMCRGDGGCN